MMYAQLWSPAAASAGSEAPPHFRPEILSSVLRKTLAKLQGVGLERRVSCGLATLSARTHGRMREVKRGRFVTSWHCRFNHLFRCPEDKKKNVHVKECPEEECPRPFHQFLAERNVFAKQVLPFTAFIALHGPTFK